MKTFSSLVVLCGLALASVATSGEAAPARVRVMYANDGARLGTIHKVTADGSALILVNGRIVTVPGWTISAADGRIQTSLTRNEVRARYNRSTAA